MTRQPLSLQHGFTLLEVLIAIVVLSFGLLGLAGIQAVGIKNTHDADVRTRAVQQAYDMADRIRANTIGAAAGAYDSIPSSVGTNPTCMATTCSATQMRDHDRFIWNTNNQAMLPSGGGTVTVATVGGTPTVIPNKQYLITVMWNDRSDPTITTPGTTCGTDITCFQLAFRP